MRQWRRPCGPAVPREADMHPIVDGTQLSPNVTRLVVDAPRIAQVRQPGQFVIVRLGPGRRADPAHDRRRRPGAGHHHARHPGGRQEHHGPVRARVGRGHHRHRRAAGQARPSSSSAGTRVCVGGGVGTAVVHPIAQGLPRAACAVTSVIGGRSPRVGDLSRRSCARYGEVVVCTDDGSYGRHGLRDRGAARTCSRRAASTASTPSARCP